MKFSKRRILKIIFITCVTLFTLCLAFSAFLPNSIDLDLRIQEEVVHQQERLILQQPAIVTDKLHYAVKEKERILDGPGEMGRPVIVEPELQEKHKELTKLYGYSPLVSDRISLNRSLPDIRLPGCQNKIYSKNLPKASVILVFHNEALSAILRNIHSIINRSPPELLEEIVLIDDFSDHEPLGKPLEDHIAKLAVTIKLKRLKERSGLIKARNHGAELAKGPALVFLDSHCECTIGWLEPLLDRLAFNRKISPCPLIDVIDAETFQYHHGAVDMMHAGGLTWSLYHTWVLPRSYDNVRSITDPLRSPTMAGGLFVIDKDFFTELGMYDPAYEYWGAENIELSLKLWMCGGSVEIIPCSRVGHVYRKFLPDNYSPKTNYAAKNNKRLVEVWLDDEYKPIYYKINPKVAEADEGDISNRLAIKEKLQCKSFKWFLENIYEESIFPVDCIKSGQVINLNVSRCLDTMQRHEGGNVGMYLCHPDAEPGLTQQWTLNLREEITNDQYCLSGNLITRNSPVKMHLCSSHPSQKWTYNIQSLEIRHSTGMCLQPASPADNFLILSSCSGSSLQKWNYRNSDWACRGSKHI